MEIYGNYSGSISAIPAQHLFTSTQQENLKIFKDWTGIFSISGITLISWPGILLQTAFLSLALGIAASYSAAPWRAGWLLTGMALVHFAMVPGAFTQIWPPLALIMPFALFVVAAASVAAGRAEHGVWLALSAGFLLHGHIAQFLFVGAILLAVVRDLAYRRLKGEPVPLPSRAQSILLAVIVALTVLPWIIDATRGRESNIFNIWLHIKQSADDPLRPSWLLAVADTASYFCYCTRQEDWFSPGAAHTRLQSSLNPDRLGVLAALSGFTACGYVLLRGRGSRRPTAIFSGTWPGSARYQFSCGSSGLGGRTGASPSSTVSSFLAL